MIAMLSQIALRSALLAARKPLLILAAPRKPLLIRAFRKPLLMLAVLILSACSILPEREPLKIYEPAHVAAPADPAWPMARWSLLVPRPSSTQLLASEAITVRPGPGAVQVYKSASWSDSVPDLVQTALVRGFEDSQKILSVARPGGGVRGEYQLVTDLRAFESVYEGGSPQAVIELYAKLVHTEDGEVVAARSFRDSEPATSTEVDDVVAAFSRSLDRTTRQVVGWTLAGGNQHESTAAAKAD